MKLILPSSMERDKERGFTLVELLVVILIIGILLAIALPTFLNQQNKAHDSSVKQGLVNTAHDAKADMTYAQAIPADLRSQLQSSEPQYSYQDGDACDQDKISVDRVDQMTAIYRMLSESGICFAYVQHYNGRDQHWQTDNPANYSDTDFSGTGGGTGSSQILTNLVPDPSAEGSGIMMADPGQFNGWQLLVAHTDSALDQVTAGGSGVYGSHAFEIVEGQGLDSSNNPIPSLTAVTSPIVSITSGNNYVGSFLLLQLSSSTTFEYRILFSGDVGFADVKNAAAPWVVASASDVGSRVSFASDAPAPAGSNYALIQMLITGGPLGSTAEFDGVQLEQGNTATAYFDGNLPPAQWTGTPNRSASTMTTGSDTGTTAWDGW